MHTQQNGAAAETDHVERMMALFAGHGGAHGTYGEPTQEPGSLKWGIKRSAKTPREPVTPWMWEQHLLGKRALGIIPITENGECRFGCIDVDEYDVNMLALVDRIEVAKLPLLPCRSKSGGMHLFLFLKKLLPAGDVIAALGDMVTRLGLKKKPEIFPKQEELKKDAKHGGKDQVGNWIAMPYGGCWGAPGAATFGGKVREQFGLKKTGAEMTLGEFLRAAEAASLDELPAPKRRRANVQGTTAEEGASYAAAKLAKYADEMRGTAEGGRNDGLNRCAFHMGTMVPRGWIARDLIEQQLGEAAEDAGLEADEVRDTLRHALDEGAKKPHADRFGTATWRDIRDKHGNPASSLANAVIGIKTLGIGCRLDLFHHVVLVDYRGGLSEIKHLVGELTDDTLGAIRSLINNQFGLDVGDANTLAAVKEIARNHAFDPVLDYLDAVQGRWDGVKRIDKWLTDYCGAPDTPFARAVGSKHLVASVRRARHPGCKYDDILVMESPEGKNKSSAIMVLAGKENFSDQTILGVEDRVAQQLMTGVWLYEIADLTDIAKADVNRVKAFASRDTDRARPAYARVIEKRPRRCTLWATTNDQRYLKSQTGNRRFLPVPVGSIDLDRLRGDRDQLWAEAAVAEAGNESITLDESLWPTAGVEQEQRRTIDPWEDILADIPEQIELGFNGEAKQIIWCVGTQERVATADLLTIVLRVPVAQQTTAHGQRLAIIMERNGWQRPAGGTLRIGTRPARGYWRPKAPAGQLEIPGSWGGGGADRGRNV
jgi:predicted P-loop ATPase